MTVSLVLVYFSSHKFNDVNDAFEGQCY